MDGNRFDSLTRALGSGRSRRGMLKGLGAAALGAVGLSRIGAAGAAGGGNSDCAHFCAAAFPPGAARGQCVSDAAHGTGACAQCGGDINRFCDGACVDLASNPANCGECGKTCDDHNTCTADACVDGQCVHTALVHGDPCGPGDTCCDGDICSFTAYVYPQTTCCSPLGGPCASTTDCCYVGVDTDCVGNGGVGVCMKFGGKAGACEPQGGPCLTATACCAVAGATATCDNHTCATAA